MNKNCGIPLVKSAKYYRSSLFKIPNILLENKYPHIIK